MDKMAAKDFSKKTIRSLADKGIAIIGIQMIPDMSKPLPWANASRAYCLDDNGMGRVRTHSEVLALAA